MEDAIKAFVMYLQVEQNASPETIRNYRSDLQQFTGFLRRTKKDTSPTCVETISTDEIRAHLHSLDRQGEKAASSRESWQACAVSFASSSVKSS